MGRCEVDMVLCLLTFCVGCCVFLLVSVVCLKVLWLFLAG